MKTVSAELTAYLHPLTARISCSIEPLPATVWPSALKSKQQMCVPCFLKNIRQKLTSPTVKKKKLLQNDKLNYCTTSKQQYPPQPPFPLASFMHPTIPPPSMVSINLALTEPQPENINPGDKTPITARSPAPFRLYS